MAEEVSLKDETVTSETRKSQENLDQSAENEEKKSCDEEEDAEEDNSNSEAEEEEDELMFPGFVAKSLYCLTQKNKLRLACLKIITWPYPFYKNWNVKLFCFSKFQEEVR